ncbi:MAG: hypothetical protein LBH16_10035 [Treponema sp.]|nr:hypothetical protein [Treponema sp.]
MRIKYFKIVFPFLFLFLLAVSCAGTPAPADNEQLTDDLSGEINMEEPQAAQDAIEEQREEQVEDSVEDSTEEPTEEITAEIPEETAEEITEEVITEEEQVIAQEEIELEEIPEEPLLVIIEPEDEAAEIPQEAAQTPSVPEPVPEPVIEQAQALPEEPADAEETVAEEEAEAEEAVAEETKPQREEPRRVIPSVPAARIDNLTQMGRTPQNSEIITHSRTVNVITGQTIEIPFRGTGWVYLGEAASRQGIDYNSRRSDPDGQSFIFKAEKAGEYSLKFYKQDFIRDYILNDHVQVIAEEAKPASSARGSGDAGWFNPLIDRGRVVAQPRWPGALDEAQLRSGSNVTSQPPAAAQRQTPTQSAAPAQSAAVSSQNVVPAQSAVPAQSTAVPVQSTAVSSQNAVPAQGALAARQPASEQPADAPASDAAEEKAESAQGASPQETVGAQSADLLGGIATSNEAAQRAQKMFDDGDAAAAIALLNQFMMRYPSGSDEVYWLLGQFYEAGGASRNILLSLDYYRRLVREFPQSKRHNDARRRISYLERFYINIQ